MSSLLRKLCLPLGTAALFGLALPGCGEKGAAVPGKVVYHDKGVGGAEVQLHPASGTGTPHRGNTGPDGTFTIINVPPGEYKVTVSSAVKQGQAPPPGWNPQGGGLTREQMLEQLRKQGKDEKDLPPEPEPGTGPSTMSMPTPLPPKYADVKTTTLTITVTKGKNDPKDFVLED